MRKILAVCCVAALLTACQSQTDIPPEAKSAATEQADTAAPATLMTWADLTSRPKPEPTEVFRYGPAPTDIVDVWLPDSRGPHRVVLMVHGGCWQKSIADRTLMNYMAEELRQFNYAVWNIEYRGVDEDGGGYPGTYQDVARAADAMANYDAQNPLVLNLDRIVGFGHSAGGHLVTWLAGRENLPASSPLAGEPKIKMRGVLNSGGLADLEASEPLTLPSCLANIKDKLTGAPSPSRPDVYADTSSERLLPYGVQTYSVNGERDRIAPPELGAEFTGKAKASGDERSQAFIITGAGHVELIAPGTKAYLEQRDHLAWLLGE